MLKIEVHFYFYLVTVESSMVIYAPSSYTY